LALLDGRAWTAGELAHHVGIARSTASEHLTALVVGGLLAEQRHGGHRYVRLSGAKPAQLVEDLAGAVGERDAPSSLRDARRAGQLAAARTCYDHLAGALGVALFDGLVAAGHLDERHGLALTAGGRAWFGELSGDDALARRGSRPLVRTCLDWTERRSHLSGAAGAVMHRCLLARGWIVRGSQPRAVMLTDGGAQALHALLEPVAHNRADGASEELAD
jgi:DNA-binding transcriptional ArsR family regulator